MATSAATQHTQKLRRIALQAQGLTRQAPFGRGATAVLRAIEQLGYVQIDTISVVERAHHQVLASRVPNYQPAMLEKLLRQGKIFEYWSHAAAFLPISDYRFALRRMHGFRNGTERWQRSRDKRTMRRVLDRISAEGPLRARDFEEQAHRSSGWWDWKPAKQALEQLFMEGRLMVVSREGFQKTYDLTERVLPEHIDARAPSLQEFAGYLVDRTLRAHAVVPLKTFTHLRPGADLRKAVQSELAGREDQGRLERWRDANGRQWWIDSDALSQRKAPASQQLHILSPFDNAVIHRDRGRWLYDYDFTIECYVPEPKRQFGYYCLPILWRDRFIGRADCKAHREQRVFEVKNLIFEPGLDDAAAIEPLASTLLTLANRNGCDALRLAGKIPARYRTPLARLTT